MLQREAPDALENSGVSLTGSEGTVDGNLTIDIPLEPQPQLHDATVDGRLRIGDAKVPKAVGKHDIQGINVGVELASGAFEAKGKFLVGNVPATLSLAARLRRTRREAAAAAHRRRSVRGRAHRAGSRPQRPGARRGQASR